MVSIFYLRRRSYERRGGEDLRKKKMLYDFLVQNNNNLDSLSLFFISSYVCYEVYNNLLPPSLQKDQIFLHSSRLVM